MRLDTNPVANPLSSTRQRLGSDDGHGSVSGKGEEPKTGETYTRVLDWIDACFRVAVKRWKSSVHFESSEAQLAC